MLQLLSDGNELRCAVVSSGLCVRLFVIMHLVRLCRTWIFMAALRSSCGLFIFVLFLSSVFFFPRLISAVAHCLPHFYTWCGLSANLECRSEMCCTWLAGNTGRKNDVKNRNLRTNAQFCLLYLRN